MTHHCIGEGQSCLEEKLRLKLFNVIVYILYIYIYSMVLVGTGVI